MRYLLSLCLNRDSNYYYKQHDGVAFRGIHWMCSVKKGVFKNFAKFTGGTLLKKRHWRKCFPVNFAKFLRTPFLQSTSGWLPLVIGFPLGTTLVKVFCFVFFLWKNINPKLVCWFETYRLQKLNINDTFLLFRSFYEIDILRLCVLTNFTLKFKRVILCCYLILKFHTKRIVLLHLFIGEGRQKLLSSCVNI